MKPVSLDNQSPVRTVFLLDLLLSDAFLGHTGRWNFCGTRETVQSIEFFTILFSPKKKLREPLGKSSDNDLQRASLWLITGLSRVACADRKSYHKPRLVAGSLYFDNTTERL